MVSLVTPEIRKRGDVTVIMFGPQFESLDDFAVEQVREFVLDAGKSAIPPNVVIDLSHTKYIDEAFIEVLFRLWNRVNGAGGRFALTGLTPYVREILEVTRLDKLWLTEWVFDEDSDCRLCIRISEPAPGTEDWMLDVGVVFADDPSVLIHINGAAFSELSDRRQSTASTTQNEHLRLVEGLWKPLQAFDWTAEEKPVTVADVVELIETSAMKLRTTGINLQLPASLENLPKVGRVDVRCFLSEDAVQKTASLSVNVLLSARLEFAVDDQALMPDELEQMARLKQPLV